MQLETRQFHLVLFQTASGGGDPQIAWTTNGRWQAVSSQSTKLTAPDGPQKFAWLGNRR
jgi:hypothetical protein